MSETAGGASPPRSVCTLGAPDLGSRVERWRSLIRGASFEPALTEGEVGLRFGRTPDLVRELSALVEQERECCAWARWQLQDEGDHVVLRIQAAPDGLATLRAMLDGRR